jgi:hypothetical protein
LFFCCGLNFLYSCQQLELQLQTNTNELPLNDAEIQCSIDKHDQITQTTYQEKLIDENILKSETEKFVSQNNILQDEINNLNFQLSTFIIQRTTTENVRTLLNIIWYFNKIYFIF